jgi:signal transduction histidine kinase
MERPVRIAVVGPVDDRLVGELRQLPLQPEVRPFVSLLADSEVLSRFEPDLLLVAFAPDAAEEVGAARLLQRLWPALAVLVVTPPERELASASIAARLSARLLPHPAPPGQLAAAIEQTLHGGDRPRPEVFGDLAHGLADEINNPLMFASGHLQLLRHAALTANERDRLSQLDSVRAGLQRIQNSVDRLRLLSQAAAGPRRSDAIDLGDLVHVAAGARAQQAVAAAVHLPATPMPLQGDKEQLTAAVAAIVQFADGLVADGATAAIRFDALPGAFRLRVQASGSNLARWHVPATFEPYYPQRALRGHAQGLGLFLCQTVVLGHRGQATVRRQPDGSLQLDFVLPAAPS